MAIRKIKLPASLLLLVFALFVRIRLQEAADGRRQQGIRGLTTASDEHTALDQALLIVKILRSEYARVLRENNELRGINTLSEADIQTCATTNTPSRITVADTGNGVTNISESTHEDMRSTRNPPDTPKQWHIRRDPIHTSSNRHRRRWRPPPAFFYYDVPLRRVYDYQDYSGLSDGKGKWRRFNYGGKFGAHAEINITDTSPTTVTSTKATVPTTVTQFSEILNKLMRKNADLEDRRLSHTLTTRLHKNSVTNKELSIYKTTNERTVSTKLSSTSPHPHIKNTVAPALSPKIRLQVSGRDLNASTISKEPELLQIAAELAKELRSGVMLAGSKVRPRLPLLWRGTTKVYLADSTRYPLPLPENHAFCYTNPSSALCRTLI